MRGVRTVVGLVLVTIAVSSPQHALPASGEVTLTGSVVYRTGPHRAQKPDRGARALLFRGEQPLALKSAARLRQFEKLYPEGLERREDRPTEQAARKAAMVLMTYDRLHTGDLVAHAAVAADGSFQLEVPSPGRYTLFIESAATAGSYHLKRYDVRSLSIGDADPDPVRVDFGVSHLEHHTGRG